MKRAIDKPYFTYSVYASTTSGISVKCPKCNGLGIVTADRGNAYFRCTVCSSSKTEDRTTYRYDVHNQCEECGRYYRVDITDKKQEHFKVLNVACPYCGCVMSGEVHKTAKNYIGTGEIKDGCEPFFGLELWFLKIFENKPIWAINREHLAYLIDYLDADLREKPIANYAVMRTQSDHLPTFMKTAKHRDTVVKLLKNMQER